MIQFFIFVKILTVNKRLPPKMTWQKNEFERHAEFRFTLPYQFLLLCKLMGVTPRQLLVDFMDNLSCGSWKRQGRDVPKQKLIDYFIEHGYGQEHYSIEDIRIIFSELDAIGKLHPYYGEEDIINKHTRWKNDYHTWWFNKWFTKNNRIL